MSFSIFPDDYPDRPARRTRRSIECHQCSERREPVREHVREPASDHYHEPERSHTRDMMDLAGTVVVGSLAVGFMGSMLKK